MTSIQFGYNFAPPKNPDRLKLIRKGMDKAKSRCSMLYWEKADGELSLMGRPSSTGFKQPTLNAMQALALQLPPGTRVLFTESYCGSTGIRSTRVTARLLQGDKLLLKTKSKRPRFYDSTIAAFMLQFLRDAKKKFIIAG